VQKVNGLGIYCGSSIHPGLQTERSSTPVESPRTIISLISGTWSHAKTRLAASIRSHRFRLPAATKQVPSSAAKSGWKPKNTPSSASVVSMFRQAPFIFPLPLTIGLNSNPGGSKWLHTSGFLIASCLETLEKTETRSSPSSNPKQYLAISSSVSQKLRSTRPDRAMPD